MIGEDNCEEEEEVLTGARSGVREVLSEKRRRVRRNSVLSCRRKRVSDGWGAPEEGR
jgi:hypothetical protein